MSEGFDFASALPEHLRAVNHNPTDHERWRKAQESIDENFRKRSTDRMREERIANLKIWDERTPARWRKASLSHVVEGPRDALMEIMNRGETSAFILGNEGSGKTYAAYAFVRRLIGHGKLLPSGVRTYTESELIELARGGFAGRDELQSIVDDKKTTAIILDGVGFADDYSDREAVAIERVIEKAYNQNLPLLVTGSVSPAMWVKRFSESTESRLRAMVKTNVVELPDRDSEPSF